MQADSPPIRGGNQDLLYRLLGKNQLWACTCKQEPLLYLRLSTKTGESYGKRVSSYKRLNSCFVAITSFHKVYYTSKGLTFFLKQVSRRVFRKMGVVLRSETLLYSLRRFETVPRMARMCISRCCCSFNIEFRLIFYINKHAVKGCIKGIWWFFGRDF